MNTVFVNYNPETKEKFQLHGTPTAKGNVILAGCYFDGWVNFNTPDQNWKYPNRIIKTESGKFYFEEFSFTHQAKGSPIWTLRFRKPLAETEASELVDHYKEMVEFEDGNYFIN